MRHLCFDAQLPVAVPKNAHEHSPPVGVANVVDGQLSHGVSTQLCDVVSTQLRVCQAVRNSLIDSLHPIRYIIHLC